MGCAEDFYTYSVDFEIDLEVYIVTARLNGKHEEKRLDTYTKIYGKHQNIMSCSNFPSPDCHVSICHSFTKKIASEEVVRGT